MTAQSWTSCTIYGSRHDSSQEKKDTKKKHLFFGTFLFSSLHGCHGLAWLDTQCPQKPLYHTPPQLDRGEKI